MKATYRCMKVGTFLGRGVSGFGDGGSPAWIAESLETGGVTFACSACSGVAMADDALQVAQRPADGASPGTRLPHWEQVKSDIGISPGELHETNRDCTT